MLEKIKIETIVEIAKQAGEVIMEIYAKDFEVEFKADESPLTEADQKANTLIEKGLLKINSETGLDIPILSEEGKHLPFEERKDWNAFWLVDPLDGTKEFVKKNGEFTVNIALIENGVPVLGVVYGPALDVTYYAKKGEGAFKNNQKLPLPSVRQEGEIIVVASKSHMSAETKEFIDGLAADYPLLTTHSIGSSLKLCLVAEGAADVYPRLGPTMEWDTGAAHAVVLEAGKKLEKFTFENGYELHPYNKENLLNSWFVVH